MTKTITHVNASLKKWIDCVIHGSRTSHIRKIPIYSFIRPIKFFSLGLPGVNFMTPLVTLSFPWNVLRCKKCRPKSIPVGLGTDKYQDHVIVNINIRPMISPLLTVLEIAMCGMCDGVTDCNDRVFLCL